MLSVGCHVSAAGGVWNAPGNAAALGCETFQIFTRPPMGGKAPELTSEAVFKFKEELERHSYGVFVVHCPYFVNFGSAEKRIFFGSVSVVTEELERANALGAKYVMTHLGSAKTLGQKAAIEQTQKGLVEVLKKYKGKTKFLLEIAAGAGEVIGDNFSELAEIMEPLEDYESFGGICFDTQHAFSSGYDITKPGWTREFESAIGFKWLKMSHVNDSKAELGGRKDRHEHIGDGHIGEKGMEKFLKSLVFTLSPKGESKNVLCATALSPARQAGGTLSQKGESKNVLRAMPLILETEHDRVKEDIKKLKAIRDKILK